MTVEKFKKIVDEHDDIMMHCGKFKFTIMTCFDQLLICEQNTENERYYDTVEDMIGKYMIGKDPLRERLSEVVLDSCA